MLRASRTQTCLMYVRASILATLALTIVACSSSNGSGSPDVGEDAPADTADTQGDVSEDVIDDSSEDTVDDSGDDTGGDGGGDTTMDVPQDVGPNELSASLPQFVDGFAYVSSSVYETIPLRIEVGGRPESVTVIVGETTIEADAGSDGLWNASVFTADLSGEVAVEVTVSASDADPASASATLLVGDDGVQFTDFEEIGMASTPTLHWHDDTLWLTWVDASTDPRRAWIQELDGGLRPVGDRVALTPADVDVVNAQAELLGESIGVLYQIPGGGPYFNTFRIVDFEGTERLAPQNLNGERFGSFGGDLTTDGEAFLVVYRSNNGAGLSDIYWMRVTPDGSVTGPTIIASSGMGDPIGAFPPFTFVEIAAGEEFSVVTWVREEFDTMLELEVWRSQAAVVRNSDGAVDGEGTMPVDAVFSYYQEAHVYEVGDAIVPLWTAQDLANPEANPPWLLYGAVLDPTDIPSPRFFPDVEIVDAPLARYDQALVAHPEHFAILIQSDERTRASMDGQHIELWTSTLDANLAVTSDLVIDHARFIASTSEMNGVPLGTNAVITWIDERHGSGLLDPRPEVYLEMLWY